jgi:hypothetical protein
MNSAAGEDLSWFWRGWYFNNWTLDLAVESVHGVDDDWHKGAVISIANLDPLVFPSTVEVQLQDGSSQRIVLAAESWIQKTRVSLRLDTNQPVTRVTIDPDHVLPDKDRANNIWRATPSP